MTICIVAYTIIHVIISVVLYGISFAYLQRYDIKNELRLTKRHRTIALLLCVGGPINAIGILSFTQFGTSGIKYWSGEKKYSDNYTIFKVRKQLNKYYSDRVVHIKAKCKDIWA